ncbi:hypothetical protein PS2_042038 [Malus domestica]
MVDEALSIFLLVASHPDGRQEIGQLSFIETLVEFMGEGTPKQGMCNFGVYEHLVEITRSGASRGQRKANALLQLISKSEQIPRTTN